MKKKCSKCGQLKELNQFVKDTRYNKGNGYRSHCKACASQYMKTYYGTTARGQYNRLRDSTSSLGIFYIEPEEFVNWWLVQKLYCYYCGCLLTRSSNRKHQMTDMTYDRKDSSKGYVIDNIALACRRCNSMKGDWLTEKQTLEIAERYFKP